MKARKTTNLLTILKYFFYLRVNEKNYKDTSKSGVLWVKIGGNRGFSAISSDIQGTD